MIAAIDFGTSNSLLAAAAGGKVFPPVPLDPSAPDPTVLRSVLFFPSPRQCFYGVEAVDEFKRNDLQGRLIRSIKKYLPQRSFVGTYVDDRPMNLEDIIAVFLGEMRRRAEVHLGQTLEHAVLGRPARFAEEDADDTFAQYRLERAAKTAGFKQVEFVPEPLAAAFELRSRLRESKIALVADFGGGTSDYTVIRISPEPFRPSDVLAIGGVSVAGDALDGAVMRGRLLPRFGSQVKYVVPFGSNVLQMPPHLVEKLCSPADMALLRKRDILEFFRNVQRWALGEKDREVMDRFFTLVEENLGFDLFEAIERCKRGLSDAEQAQLVFTYPGIGIDEEVSRKEFEGYVAGASARILGSLDETLKKAGIKPEKIELVFCTGGTAKVPLLQRELVRRFGAEKIQERNHFHSIVQGLALRAAEIG